jgi:hypothetical protein
MVWGYVLGRFAGGVRSRPNLPLLILAGALLDFDLFTGQPYATVLGHHGIAHSPLVILVCAIPFFVAYGTRPIPYFIAVIQHTIFGDFITNQIPLLFPLTFSEVGINLSETFPLAAVGLELSGFVLFIVVFLMSGDWKRSFEWSKRNLLALALWMPPLLLTIYQSFIYFEPEPVTELYVGYALICSVTLLAIALIMATQSRSKIRKRNNR